MARWAFAALAGATGGEKAMQLRRFLFVAAALALFWPAGARAGGLGPAPGFTLSCDNGQSYPMWPKTTTVTGEVVTGYIRTSSGRAVHVRLIPMGVGYRYAAPGLWLDGVRGDAELNFGTRRSVTCTVQSS
jgi:hypothetical protein